MKSLPLFYCILFVQLSFVQLFGQQIPDTTAFFTIEKPHFIKGEGPIVQIDAAHNNFHTLEGRYHAFARILRTDGYQVVGNQKTITKAVLEGGDIFVISNAIHEKNEEDWKQPIISAFTNQEIKAINDWVKEGGSLFLIADHMPFGGAAKALAQSFGVEYLDAFAMDLKKKKRGPDKFTVNSGLYGDHPVIMTSSVKKVVSFTGSAFKLPEEGAAPIIALDDRFTILLPEEAWEFSENTAQVPTKNCYQLATLNYGKGKVVFSGEAAMFSAQLAGPNQFPMGLNNPVAKQNVLLLIHLLKWLTE